MDTLQLKERIEGAIGLGESQFREFKSAYSGPKHERKARNADSVARDIGEALVGFANAEGGELLIGVEDDGTVTGISFSEAAISNLLKAPQNRVYPQTPLQDYAARQLSLPGGTVLYFAVEKSTKYVHLTSDGRCLQRRDRATVPVSSEQLQFERQEQVSREYDRHFVDGALPIHLDLDVIKRVADHVAPGMSAEKCLQFLGLADYGVGVLRLRRAALLLFAQDVSRWHPRCEVRIVRVRGNELGTGRDYNVILDETANGNILGLLNTAWEKLRPHLVETKFAPEAIFRERVMYPEDACREALTNAIAHRDYSIEGRNIEIMIFDDRMEVSSPGGLLSTVTIDELNRLHGLHQSRNALIAKVLREIGYMREIGEGMRRIFGLMREHDLVPPELYSEANRFSIILRHKSVFSDSDQRWLDGFRPLRLTREEMLVALLGRDGNLISPQQIWDTLDLVDTSVYATIVEQMQIKGMLYSTTRGGGRDRPRLRIRPPDECEKNLTEFLHALGSSEPSAPITVPYLQSVARMLPSTNPYRTAAPPRLTALMRILELMDENRQPKTLLQNLWMTRKRKTALPVNVIPADRESAETSRHARSIERKTRRDKKVAVPFNVFPAERESTEALRQTRSTDRKMRREKWGIFVGNLDWNSSQDDLSRDLRELFARHGVVVKVGVPVDFVTRKTRGFGFVDMATEEQALAAKEAIDGAQVHGRQIRLDWSDH
jgi:ATP-dependent DNA helicase RecG